MNTKDEDTGVNRPQPISTSTPVSVLNTDEPSEGSESIPPSGYSTPVLADAAKPLDPMQVKRFAYLLGQTDVFSHFIQDFIKDENLKAEIKRQLESTSARNQND
ncbi:hypothetical protein LPJ57_010813, partial [Coemansia sp. RSA 486]